METEQRGRLTFGMVVGIVNPGAVILSALAPAILGVILAYEAAGGLSVLLTLFAVAIPVLFNASVNLLNDYYDFIRGNDTGGNISDAADAPLAYYGIRDARPILWLGLGCLLLGAGLGMYIVWHSGLIPLVIGVIGALTVVLYSGGKLPLSHLPLGEVVAGFVMGGLIPLGVYSALTGSIDWLVLYKSVPMMFIVAQIMLLNNTCDIERDRAVGRRTLPILIGRERALTLARAATAVWVIQMLHVTVGWYLWGTPLVLVMLAVFSKLFMGIGKGERTGQSKARDIGPVAGAGLGVAVCLPAACLVHIFFG